ncbi:MAG TPA: ribbon-helix-helix protein, CopG family [Trebonia sp.]|nr:ribbon-helix-helix protein, CopG family [Trebonia sp.]
MHRTTFRIDEEILAEAKALAARQHRSLNSVMEEALRRMIKSANERQDRPRVQLVTYGDPNDRPLIDTSPEGIKRFFEDEDIARHLEVTANASPGHERPDQRPSA